MVTLIKGPAYEKSRSKFMPKKFYEMNP
jgi:hypothetical protein